jgi:protein O-GlcNAc transferase
MTVEEVFNLALQKHQARQFADAEPLYRQAIAARPDHCASYNNLGGVLCELKRYAEAVACFRQALVLQPDNFRVMNNLGNALRALGETDQAIGLYIKGLAQVGEDPNLLGNLGTVLIDKRRYDEAIGYLRRAIVIQPDAALAYYNLGVATEALGRKTEAVSAYRQAIALEPRLAAAHNNLGGLLQARGDTEEAIACCRRAIGLEPDMAAAHNSLGNALFQSGLIDQSMDAYRRASELSPDRSDFASNLLFAPYYDPNCDFSTILTRFDDWNRRFADPLKPLVQPHPKPAAAEAEKRLRIGYISPNLRAHAEGAFILPLLDHHDHDRFEIFCYFDDIRTDAVTQRMRKGADVWRDITALSHAEVAERIRADGIDILVDLTMHMGHGRPETIARKPAPVQVAYLAYPGTTGLAAMDYRLTDAFVDPPEFQAHYTETCVRLPRTFACYDPAGMDPEHAERRADEIDPGPPPAQANGYATFGSLNNFSKVNSAVLARWSGALNSLPTSRLLLLAPDGEPRRRVLEELARHGVDRGRVDFVGRRTRADYMKEFRRIDVTLDTLPYCGHTTTLDSIWMGVPVVTRIGPSAAGRVGWSVANNLGLTDLAADTDEKFAQIAAALASDLPRLTELRRTLRNRLLASPIMDGAAFTRDMEDAYRRMWKRWVAA